MARRTGVTGAGLGFITDFLTSFRQAIKDAGGEYKDILVADPTTETGRVFLAKWAQDVVQAARGTANVFPIWKTIQLGTYRSAKELLEAFEAGGYRVSSWASDILNRVVVSTALTTIDLVVVSVAELGFKDGATFKQICECAFKLGFEFCPVEVGVQLRLQYADQPMGEWLIIAHGPISGSGGVLDVFRVGHDRGGRWLDGGSGYSGSFWSGGNRFVFARRK